MLAKIRTAVRKDDGASAVEYGLLVAAIAALIVVVVFALGNLVSDVFENTCTQLEVESAAADPTVELECDLP